MFNFGLNKKLSKKLEELEENITEMKEKETYLQGRIAALSKQAGKFGSRIDAVSDVLGDVILKDTKLDKSKLKTSQEKVWSDRHGFRYVIHHMGEDWKTTRIPLWTMLLGLVPDAESVFEFGCNIGANLKAINYIKPELELGGMDINQHAINVLEKDKIGKVNCGSIITDKPKKKYDFVFSRGVLIHINPNEVAKVMKNMADSSKKYVMIFEHYSENVSQPKGYAKRVEGGEQGEGYQFWQDFSGKFAELYPDWHVVQEGINTKPGKKPSHGKLHWTIFKRPA